MKTSLVRGEKLMESMLGQIVLFGGNVAPRGWEFCAGQLIPVNMNVALFSVLGKTFGGDGWNNFALPDLRNRTRALPWPRTDPPSGPLNYIIAVQGGEKPMEPMLGQIVLFGDNLPPKGWAFCAAQPMTIDQNYALYSLLGTTFGGGKDFFRLPDLHSQVIPSPLPDSRPQGPYMIALVGTYPEHKD
jgi:microcystin-dependent protein